MVFSHFREATSSPAPDARAEGDRLRDAGEFAAAAAAYARHLAAEPSDFGIWVQRGNCLKDAGMSTEALEAYQAAQALRDDDADLHLQLGHLHKLAGRKAAAREAYARSLSLAPSEAARRELAALTPSPSAAAPDEFSGPGGALLIDVTDLIWFLQFHNRVTGIQRVVSCLADEATRLPAVGRHTLEQPGGRRVRLVYFDSANGRACALELSSLRTLLDELLARGAPAEVIEEARARVLGAMRPLTLTAGDRYVIAGAFWATDGYERFLPRLRRDGVLVGAYVYDLIPFSHPQFVTDSTLAGVQSKFVNVLSLLDFAITISDFVGGELNALLRLRLGEGPPIATVPLAHDLPAPRQHRSEPGDKAFDASVPEAFALCVGTIELRKNPALLVDVWSALHRKHGARLPSLVLVGKWGWDSAALRERLERLDYVDGKIVLFNGLSDQRLKSLYEKCLFTIFPSFAEGWGLPVGESLAYGKPCVASNATSIPEVGGDLCVYVDPFDMLGAGATIERLLFDEAERKRLGDAIAARFAPRGWEEVARLFLESVESAGGQVERAGVKPFALLEAGRVHRLTRCEEHASTRAWRAARLGYVLADGWFDVEEWGAWSKQPQARVIFDTSLEPGAALRVLLQLTLPPSERGADIFVSAADGARVNVKLAPGASKWIALAAKADAARRVAVLVEKAGEGVTFADGRPLFVGLRALAYHADKDLGARLDLLEEIALFSD